MRNARFVEETKTTADYRLFALRGTTPPKPGMLRVTDGEGAAITVEVWAMTAEAFGNFVAAIPPPLTIGDVRLAGGRSAKGFLAEAKAVEGARDISSFGGWRAFVASKG
jgi:allophanate hydrolase